MPDSAEVKTINLKLDFDKLREIAALGIRRATVFMGIAANAARVDPPISYVLDDRAQFSVLPPDLGNADRKRFAEEFESWNIGNGFREITETFDVFLTEVYGIVHLVEKGKVPVGGLGRVKRMFSFKGGVSDHMQTVCDLLGIGNRFDRMFSSMREARNCMAHRRGVVGVEDGATLEKPLVFHWRTRAMFLEDGTDVSKALHANEEVFVEAEQKLLLKEVERSKTFALGEAIKLRRYELAEICFGVTIATEFIGNALLEFGKAKGLTIEEPSSS